ncbi:MAG TPA: exosortase H-associated membrane protein [Xanthomonadales bacterium]|nr:exosortase H-associated membrane protein [Xanthomonadales bacterium]
MNENHEPNRELADEKQVQTAGAESVDQKPPARKLIKPRDELRLSELLILATLWMLFGFMLWFYLSAFHGTPSRLAAEAILSHLLGDHFYNIIVNPEQHFLFQVQTTFMFDFRDGTTDSLGFIVNPLVYSYGLPLLFGLVMGSDVSWLRKFSILAIGYVTITAVQIWGVVWQSLKMLAFNFGSQTHVIIEEAGISDEAIAMGYQLGSLILPALAPIFVWVLANRPLVEQFVGWKADDISKLKQNETS